MGPEVIAQQAVTQRPRPVAVWKLQSDAGHKQGGSP